MVTIRRATPEDAPAIARVHDSSLWSQGTDQYTEEQLAAMAPRDRDLDSLGRDVLDRDERYVAVAEDEDEVAGVGGVQLTDGRLLGIFVSPDHMGEGVGSALIDHIESRAREEGLSELTIFSALNAVGFYEANSFQRVGRTDEGGIGGPLGGYDSDSVDISSVELRKEL